MQSLSKRTLEVFAKTPIPEKDDHPRKSVLALDAPMSYADAGRGLAVVFLHGNPASAYLRRNVIPRVSGGARCLAPGLAGMGRSENSPSGSCRFADRARYLDAWFDAVLPEGDAVIVGHDWGSALGFHWANRNRERAAGLVYMEAIVQSLPIAPHRAFASNPMSARAP